MIPADGRDTPTSLPGPLRWAGLVLGTVLLVSAIATVAVRHELIGEALDAVRAPALPQVGLLVGTVVANLLLTGLLFSLLISRYGKVGVVEMQALIASAALLNFLPLRPGLLGRITYHRAINQIPIAATLKTTLQALGLSVALAGYVALALLVAARLEVPLWAAIGLALPLLAAAASVKRWRLIAAAAAIRYVEVLLLAVRYHAAFA